jgi:hypothetical protein
MAPLGPEGWHEHRHSLRAGTGGPFSLRARNFPLPVGAPTWKLAPLSVGLGTLSRGNLAAYDGSVLLALVRMTERLDAETWNRYRLRLREAVRDPSASASFARFGQDDRKRDSEPVPASLREAVRDPSASASFARFGQDDRKEAWNRYRLRFAKLSEVLPRKRAFARFGQEDRKTRGFGLLLLCRLLRRWGRRVGMSIGIR